jgi:hypothetical protein
MNVWVLGAGCSKSYEQSPTGQKMPVAKDFFKTYGALDISSNLWVLIGDILNFARDEYGVDPLDFGTFSKDMEAFHSLAEQRFLELSGRPRSQLSSEEFGQMYQAWKAYLQLIFLFASVVNEIQNGPVSPPHVAIAHQLSKGDHVLTFNWDCLMDRALHHAPGFLWNPRDGYGIQPKLVFRDGWHAPDEVEGTSAVRLLKLHGSSNWITSYLLGGLDQEPFLAQQAPAETFYIYHSGTQPYPTYAGRYMSGYQPFSYGYYPPNIPDDPGRPASDGHAYVKIRPKHPWMPEGTADDSGLTSMPLIIPPVRNKKYSLFGSLFERIWAQAEDALATCDRIIMIGYSFPQTDVRSAELFSRAFLRRRTVPHVVIVNPAPQAIAHKFSHELGVPSDRLQVFEEYWTNRSNPARLLA